MSLLHSEAQQRLAEHFSQSSGAAANAKWDALWAKGDFLPWDRKTHHPALEDLLKARPGLLGQPRTANGRRRRALVPGCGGGYDVLLLASLGWDATGLEVSTHAIQAAQRFQQEHFADYVKEHQGADPGSVQFILGDFFQQDWLDKVPAEPGQGFDVIFDYTFLCALAPAVRPSWARRHCQLLSTSSDARLVCVEFPSTKPPSANGPPFGVNPDVYDAHLGYPGQTLAYTSHGYPDTAALKALQTTDAHLRLVSRIQPARTHPAGYGPDGQVTDRVSVWTHARSS